MVSLQHFLKNVGGLLFVSLFLLYAFMTQAQDTPEMNGANAAQQSQVSAHQAVNTTVAKLD